MSLILDGTNGLSDVDGTAASPAIRGSDTAAIVAEKQRLRDITALAEQATTLDELKAIEL
jgi:hypothetical protein